MSQSASAYEYVATDVFRRCVRLLVTSRPVAWLSARLLGHYRVGFRVIRGRFSFSSWVTGLPGPAAERTAPEPAGHAPFTRENSPIFF